MLSWSLKATGTAPRGRLSPPLGAESESTCAEAPRPAHDRIDGRSPGLRVTARHRLPGLSQWRRGSGSPLTVAGAAADLEPPKWFDTAFPVRSHVRDRRCRSLSGRHVGLVNAVGISRFAVAPTVAILSGGCRFP